MRSLHQVHRRRLFGGTFPRFVQAYVFDLTTECTVGYEAFL